MLGVGVYNRSIESIVNDCTTDMIGVDMIIREWMYYKWMVNYGEIVNGK